MQPKVELNKIRSFSETIDDSILFFKQNWKPLLKAYFTICGFFWVTSLLLGTFNQFNSFKLQDQGESIFGLTYFLSAVFELVNYAMVFLTTLSYITIYQQKEKEAPTVEEVWGYVKFYFFRVTGSFILVSLLVAVGLVMCFIPGIYLGPIMALVLTIMIVENTSLRYAFSRSFRLISDSWWYTFGVIFMMSLIIAISMLLFVIPAAAIASVIVFITGTHAREIYMTAMTITLHLVQFLHIMVLIAIALVYYNLTEQKEDLTLLQRIQMFGQHTPQTQQPPAEEEY